MSAAKVWLLGGRGLVGQAVSHRLAALKQQVIVTGSEVDIRSLQAVRAFANEHRPSHIINCAAMTQVDACESQAEQAMDVNGHGPGHVAQAALDVAAAVVHLSSDYVFDGTHPEPRTEDDGVAPKSAYGRSKLLGEQRFMAVLQQQTVPHYILRTSWVFGPGGGNFVSTMLRLMNEREAVQVVADQHGRPTYTPDLARAITDLMGLGVAAGVPCPSGVYHFANSGSTTWHGLCSEVLAQAQVLGHKVRCVRVEPVTTAAFPRPAPRPVHSILCTDKFEQAAHWVPQAFEQAVAQYMATMTRP